MRDLLMHLRTVYYYRADLCFHVVHERNVMRNDHTEVDKEEYVL